MIAIIYCIMHILVVSFLTLFLHKLFNVLKYFHCLSQFVCFARLYCLCFLCHSCLIVLLIHGFFDTLVIILEGTNSSRTDLSRLNRECISLQLVYQQYADYKKFLAYVSELRSHFIKVCSIPKVQFKMRRYWFGNFGTYNY